MSYYSEVGCRLAIKVEFARKFYSALLNAYNKEYEIKDTFAPHIDTKLMVLNKQNASDVCSEFYYKAGDYCYWNSVYDEIKSIFDNDAEEVFIIEMSMPSVQWYNCPLVDFWKGIYENDEIKESYGIVEYSFCRIGEEGDVEEYEDTNYEYIDSLYPITAIDWN